MSTGTQTQHERRGEDPRIEEILAGNKTILGILQKREVEDALLAQRVENIELEVKGKDGEGGIKAKVAQHEQRINLAIGGMVVLTGVGGFLGWCGDKLFKAVNR